MSWEAFATVLSTITLIAVTAITLISVMGIADPLLVTRCEECRRSILDFQHAHTLCRHCRHAHTATTSRLFHLPALAGRYYTPGGLNGHRN